MDLNQKLIERIEYLINFADKVLDTTYEKATYRGRIRIPTSWVNEELFKEFQSSCSSFILNLYGKEHPYFINFENSADSPHPLNVKKARGVLKSINTEITKGWLTEIKSLVSAEIFADFLDMAKYLLDENYKDPAAVMIGSVLEENLRQIATKNSISLDFTNHKVVTKPKKADTINSEITKAGIYSKLDQKQVTAWLDLRNKSAHGLYDQYKKEQVELMYQGVLNFIVRNNNQTNVA